ncbi:MAG: gluconate 2-dehydrogenase subunit 3 family protein, partial [Candidatus Thermoplasmatota archaeon]
MKLTPSERESLRLLADTFVPRTGDPREPLGGSASDLGVDGLIAQAIEEYQPADVQKQFLQLLRVIENPALNLLITGRAMRFRNLAPQDRERYLLGWARSRLGAKRRGFHAMKRLACFLYYSALPDGKGNPNWRGIGYTPPDPRNRPTYTTAPELRRAQVWSLPVET